MLLYCATCKHHKYCHLSPEKDGGICFVVHNDPTIYGLVFVHPDTIKNAIKYLRNEIKHIHDFKSAYDLYRELKKK